MPMTDPLAELRGIHAIDPWLAILLTPGFWLIVVVILLLLAGAITIWRKWQQRNAFRRQALTNLNTLDAFQDSDPILYLQQLNGLLKQTALVSQPRTDVASLTGNNWLSFLDETSSGNEFSQGSGKILIDGPYRAQLPAQDLSQLKLLAQRWIKEHKPAC